CLVPSTSVASLTPWVSPPSPCSGGPRAPHSFPTRRSSDLKMYSLDHKKKTYSETTFAEQRAELQKAMEQMEKGQASQQQAASGVDESECVWSDPKADVLRSVEKSQIAGYDAERVTIVATQSCKNKKTGEVCDFGLVLEQWVA